MVQSHAFRVIIGQHTIERAPLPATCWRAEQVRGFQVHEPSFEPRYLDGTLASIGNVSYYTRQAAHIRVQRSYTIHTLIIIYSSAIYIHITKCIIRISSANRILINEALKMCIINHFLIYASNIQ